MRTLLLVILVVGCKHQAADNDHSKIDLATLQVKKLALDAFPQWAMRNAAKACPDSLDDLKDFVNNPDMNDPWGHPVRMVCGPTAPAGVRGLGAYSLGPDGKDGTADDIKSWADAKN
jgi:hypothetical protein